jgi:ethanolaminephosphotransferase
MHLERLARQEKEIGARRSGNKKAEGGKMGAWTTHVSLLTLWTGVSLVSVMVACTLLRTHLFIWTVFSPKFLFAAAWGVGWAAGLV